MLLHDSFPRENLLGIVDVVEVVTTGLFAGAIAVIVTLGKNETCKTLEDQSTSVSCVITYHLII